MTDLKQAEELTTEFFKRRFPNKDIVFEKKCGYFDEWVARFMSGRPETSMDDTSLDIWNKMKEEKAHRLDEEKKMNKKDIFNKAHLEESNGMAREYFEKCGLKIVEVRVEHAKKLSEFISAEIYPLLLDEEYNMVKELRMSRKIKQGKYGIFLYTDGSYFTEREAISFRYDNDLKIMFCNWAVGCNRIPYIRGFIKWCDWMVKK